MSTPTRPTAPAPEAVAAPATTGKKHHPLRTTLIVLGTVLAVLLGVFFVGGGWYFSDKIHNGGLTASHWDGTPNYDLTVTAVSPTSITLDAVGDAPLAFTQKTSYALIWPGGSGHVGPPTATTGETVTRPLSDVTGTQPAAGGQATLERDWYIGTAPDYVGNPEQALGLAYQDVSVAGPLGPLPAWYVPVEGATTTAVFVHGRGGTRREMLRFVPLATKAGMNALVVSYRNDAGVAPDPSDHDGWGVTEWGDLAAAVDWALANGTQRVVLWGDSHGAAVVAAYLREAPTAGKVVGTVLDSPGIDFGEAVDNGAAKMSLPVIGSVPPALIWTAKRISTMRFGVDWGYVDYASDPTWVRAPVLVVHGDADPEAPISASQRFAANNPGTVTLVTFPGAAHLEGWNTERARYEQVVSQFLTRMSGTT